MKNYHLDTINCFLLSLFLFSTSCIELYHPNLGETNQDNLLVVEGKITDQPGPFKVRLSESVPLYDDPNLLYQDHPVLGADVQIHDDRGNSFRLYEDPNGWYETKEKKLKGTVGNTYVLTITTPDGRNYESLPVLMQKVPDIRNIVYEEFKYTDFGGEEPEEKTWLNILIDSEAPDDGNICLKWEFDETWEFDLPSYISVNHGMGEGDPPPTMETIYFDYEKKHCWRTEVSGKILVESTVGYQGNRVKNYILQSTGPPEDKLNIKYSIQVKQYALNRDIYNLFKKINEANTETEGLYSKIPGQAFGNIICCNDGKKALGFFFASAVSIKRIFIDYSDVNIEKGNGYEGCGWTTKPPGYQPAYLLGTDPNGTKVYSTNKYCTDCRIRGTNIKPDFWE